MVKKRNQMRHSVQPTTHDTEGSVQPFPLTNISCTERAGFTLIELMVVLIVVGILSAMALPRYSATLERSRQSEAISILGSMRGAQLRHAAENSGAYTSSLTALDIDLPDNDGLGTPGDGKFFNYITAMTGESTATRNSLQKTAGSDNYRLRININGTISCVSPDDCAGGP